MLWAIIGDRIHEWAQIVAADRVNIAAKLHFRRRVRLNSWFENSDRGGLT
jgi:hypothetical protein